MPRGQPETADSGYAEFFSLRFLVRLLWSAFAFLHSINYRIPIGSQLETLPSG